MKKYLIYAAIILATLFSFLIMIEMIQYLREENKRLESNQEILLSQNVITMAESQKYKVSDSLNAARVSQLEFTITEYERFRREDYELIKRLKAGKSDLQKIVSSQSATINNLKAKLNDSVVSTPVITDSTVHFRTDTLKCFEYKSKWIDISGCINLNADSVSIELENRESLKIAESVTYKRFLGFLWKTNKIKSRQVDVVSENPNTEIISVEYISIK